MPRGPTTLTASCYRAIAQGTLNDDESLPSWVYSKGTGTPQPGHRRSCTCIETSGGAFDSFGANRLPRCRPGAACSGDVRIKWCRRPRSKGGRTKRCRRLRHAASAMDRTRGSQVIRGEWRRVARRRCRRRACGVFNRRRRHSSSSSGSSIRNTISIDSDQTNFRNDTITAPNTAHDGSDRLVDIHPLLLAPLLSRRRQVLRVRRHRHQAHVSILGRQPESGRGLRSLTVAALYHSVLRLCCALLRRAERDDRARCAVVNGGGGNLVAAPSAVGAANPSAADMNSSSRNDLLGLEAMTTTVKKERKG